MNRKIRIVTSIVFGIALGIGIWTPAVSHAASAADILNDLHASNVREIHMGQIAQSQSVSADTRDYGKTLVNDHTSADEKVKSVAAKEGVTLKPEEPGMMDKMDMKKLKSENGTAFDKDFSDSMISDHQKDIKKLQDALGDSALSVNVRNLINELLPTLQKHLEIAQKIQAASSK